MQLKHISNGLLNRLTDVLFHHTFRLKGIVGVVDQFMDIWLLTGRLIVPHED